MKKILALLLAAMMTLSLAACGSDTGSTDEDSVDTAVQDTAEPSADDDFAYIQGNGSMKIGFTYFEPMNYMDDNGEFVGFETEFATAVCEKLGVEPEFVEINWDSKVMELESKNIDCIWNGMTITPELEEALTISDPYIKNYQVVVIRADNADTYTTTADLVGKTVRPPSPTMRISPRPPMSPLPSRPTLCWRSRPVPLMQRSWTLYWPTPWWVRATTPI